MTHVSPPPALIVKDKIHLSNQNRELHKRGGPLCSWTHKEQEPLVFRKWHKKQQLLIPAVPVTWLYISWIFILFHRHSHSWCVLPGQNLTWSGWISHNVQMIFLWRTAEDELKVSQLKEVALQSGATSPNQSSPCFTIIRFWVSLGSTQSALW